MEPSLKFILSLLLISLISAVAGKSILRTLSGDHPALLSAGVSSSSSAAAAAVDNDLYCDSWRLSAETNNAGVWSTIPEKCTDFVGGYMSGDRYASDSAVVAGDSMDFAASVQIAGDGKDVWIFDVDETLLSNAPYYSVNGWGSELFNETSFDEWVNLAKAPALPSSLNLYNQLQKLNFSIILLTGRSETQRNVTEENLVFAGYSSWIRLILREESDIGKTAVVYKSGKRAELIEEGFRIHGNSGDQWSDLFGLPMANRSFKLPNPMYYIS